MKKCFVFILCCVLLVVCIACTNTSLCTETDCEQSAGDSVYCRAHARVYEREREFYPFIQPIVNRIAEPYAYSVMDTYRLEEVLVHYAKPATDGDGYILEIYCHYTVNDTDYFTCYPEWKKQQGETPKNEQCTQEEYAYACMAAHGGLETHQTKLRAKHFAQTDADAYEYDEYFALNFADYRRETE